MSARPSLATRRKRAIEHWRSVPAVERAALVEILFKNARDLLPASAEADNWKARRRCDRAAAALLRVMGVQS